MLKKTLLSALLAASTIATAQINLDLSLTLNQDTENSVTGAIVVDENVTTSIVFNGLDSMVVNLLADTNDDIVSIQTQFFQKTETEELVAITELLPVQVALGNPATITINDQDSSNTLTLTITPTTATAAATTEE